MELKKKGLKFIWNNSQLGKLIKFERTTFSEITLTKKWCKDHKKTFQTMVTWFLRLWVVLFSFLYHTFMYFPIILHSEKLLNIINAINIINAKTQGQNKIVLNNFTFKERIFWTFTNDNLIKIQCINLMNVYCTGTK